VGRLVTLLRERRKRRSEASGERLKCGHAEILLMVKPGICRLPTSCAAGVDASQRRPNTRRDSHRYLFLTLPYWFFRTTLPIPLVVIHSLASRPILARVRNVRSYAPPPPAVNKGPFTGSSRNPVRHGGLPLFPQQILNGAHGFLIRIPPGPTGATTSAPSNNPSIRGNSLFAISVPPYLIFSGTFDCAADD
jgi:hypothetical protein